jgi:hypothetical protein
MATTKKLTPVKRASAKSTEAPATPESSSPLFTQTEVLEELKKQTEYLHRMDWKLWMIMNMVRIIGEENGYTFRLHQGLSDMDNIKENE